MAWKPNPNSSGEERIVAIETMLCEMLNRLFGNGQAGELEKMRHFARELDRRLTEMERDDDVREAGSKYRAKEQAQFYMRAGLVVTVAEALIHGLGWIKDALIALMAGGRPPHT